MRAALLLDAAMAGPAVAETSMPLATGPAPASRQDAAGVHPAEALAAPTPAPSDAAEAVRRWGSLALALPWLVGVLGLAMSVPVLIWAPLLGGLCLGLVGLQVGLARGWVQRRQALPVEEDGLRAQHPGSARAERNTPTGILLAAMLAVFGVLAVLVLYTAALHKRETVSASDILRVQDPQHPREPELADKNLPAAPLTKSP